MTVSMRFLWKGEERGFLRQFLSGVVGGEVASLHFAAQDHALFVTIQHPGEPGTGPDSSGSTFETPNSVWPDGNTHRGQVSLWPRRKPVMAHPL